jgi:ATP/ADP translocase
VTTHVWNNITLVILACLIMLLHVLVMTSYSTTFAPSSDVDATAEEEEYVATGRGGVAPKEPTLWSGIYLMLQHNYVLLILGASCLYEISLTCLNYQMTLLGWQRFEETEHSKVTFTQFMGHYGQMVNISSLVLSSVVFPFLIRRFGLRRTLWLFPTLLLLANILAFAVKPGNLAVLFVSLSVLKAMTYSIHDPSKEILYIPTSNAIKFKSKFWIDVVGARFAKAIGSSINNYAGSVQRSIRVASAPSLLTSVALWWVCYRVGTQFEQLVARGAVVGLDADPLTHEVYDNIVDDDEEAERDVEETKVSVELTAS